MERLTPPVGDAWSARQFNFQNTDAYRSEYLNLRESCKWSPPVPLINFTVAQPRATYPFGGAWRTRWRGGTVYDGECSRRTWSLPVQTCRIGPLEDASGDLVETTITRIGPVHVKPPTGTHSSPVDGWYCFWTVPMRPRIADMGRTAYLVDTIDHYFAPTTGAHIDFPPLHPHHSSSVLVAEPGAISPRLADFTVLPVYTTTQFAAGSFVSSMNTPGFNVDHLGCEEEEAAVRHGGVRSDPSACFYVRLPPHRGYPLFPRTDMWTTAILEAPVQSLPPVDTMLEFGRKYVLPRRTTGPWTPVYHLDFSVSGSGRTYVPAASVPASHTTESLAFHTFTMPTSGRFVASWFHTHGAAPSEMWVLDRPVKDLLPMAVLSECVRRKRCRREGNTFGTFGMMRSFEKSWNSDVPLTPLGLSISKVQALVRQRAGPTGLRCAYHSRNQLVDGKLFARQAMRLKASASSCDGWAFRAGQEISLLAFNHRTNLSMVDQHQRWFPAAELDGVFAA